jgi:hypothetical protein
MTSNRIANNCIESLNHDARKSKQRSTWSDFYGDGATGVSSM